MKSFSSVNIGDCFYLVEDGCHYSYKKVSETEAVLLVNDVITDFSPEYTVFL